MSAETQLAPVPPKETALAVFSADKGLEPWLQQIRTEIDGFTPDITTRKGREAVASMAYKVARSKTALDDVGKKLVAELKEIPKKIDAERKRVRDTLDAWQEEVRRPLNEWQAAEDARVEKHTDGIDWLRNRDDMLSELSAEQIRVRIAETEAVAIGEQWEEFEAEASREKDKALGLLRAALTKREQFEAEQAELARLRAEADERAKADREAAIAKEAAEKARLEAEQRAQAEREEAARREREAAQAAERRELELQMQAEQAQRAAEKAEADRVAAEQRAEQNRIDTERRHAEALERARLDEIARQEAKAAEAARQQAAREADKAHKAKIMGAAKEALMGMNISEELAKAIVLKIARREVPNITINF